MARFCTQFDQSVHDYEMLLCYFFLSVGLVQDLSFFNNINIIKHNVIYIF